MGKAMPGPLGQVLDKCVRKGSEVKSNFLPWYEDTDVPPSPSDSDARQFVSQEPA